MTENVAPFIHPLSDVQSIDIGVGTRIWQYSVVLPGAKLGRDCNICAHCFIENRVVLGDRVTVKSGVQLWDGIRAEDDVFIGPNASFANDPFPRSKVYTDHPIETVLKRKASIGSGAVILPGVEIGAGAMVGAGAVVTRSVPPHAIVVGNPARIVGYADSSVQQMAAAAPDAAAPMVAPTNVKGVSLFHFPIITDMRGSITVGDFGSLIPFYPRRYFMVHAVPSAETRGAHAHKSCMQMLICVSGSCAVVADDGTSREEFTLNRPNVGLFLPNMVWGIQYKYSEDAVLLVFASEHYDPDDYIRDYDSYLALTGASPR